MPRSLITFIKGDRVGAETEYRDALPVNMYAVERPILDAKGYMVQASGLTEVASGPGIGRGGVWNDIHDTQYRVSGDKLVSVSGSGVITELGTVAGAETASLPYSFSSQGVVAGGRFYLYDTSLGFREVTDPDLGSPIDAVWVDGYYFFTDGKNIYHTNITDESSIDPLKFATAEFIPDGTYGVAKTEDNKVQVFGRYSIEYFLNDASADFAFRRIDSRAMKLGIVGTHCKAQSGGKTYIMGGRREEDVSVYVLGVGSAQRVSTREIEKVINQYPESVLNGAVLEAFEDLGTNFIVVHLQNETLVFNETIAKSMGPDHAWSLFKSDVAGDEPWRAIHAVFDNRTAEWTFGDRRDGTIGRLDNSVATHYGNIAEWILYTPFMYLEGASVDQVDIETMPGFTSQPDATVFMSLTYNGVTYGKEWTEMYGEPADYGKRFVLRRLGYVRDWVGMKLRGASTSRMAFGRGLIDYG